MSKTTVNKKKKNFSLKIPAVKDIHAKYELNFTENNFTNIKTDLESSNEINSLVFLDEARKIHKCILTKIDFTNSSEYCCFWCRSTFNSFPIGCPIKYIPSIISRTYMSEITKEKFIVKENITKTCNIDPGIETTIENNDYYDTDGVFCSFNCCIAYIKENKHLPMYSDSEVLFNKIQKEILQNNIKISPSPHWRLLKQYGGILDIETFRSNFTRIEYEDKGIYKPSFKSIAYSFEEKIKL